MKRVLAFLLVCSLCFSGVAMAESGIASTSENTLTVGVSSMNGDFIDGFGSNALDTYIKYLLHTYCDTYELTTAGEYVENPAIVKEYKIDTDEAGNKTYTFTLCDDLKWSDGSAITAEDYVGSILWKASPKWLEAGASSTLGQGLVGYKDYVDGKTDVFAGVKLIDDHTFSCTIDVAELPYFYEYNYVAIPPMCMATYAPGCTIIATDEGCSFDPEYDVLAAMQTVSQTERFHPTVVCGPYRLLSYENNTATLEINEYFKGDLDGDKPTIQYIVQKVVPEETDVDALIAGEIDLLTAVTEGKKIEAAKAAENIQEHSYYRNGYGLMAFACDWGPTADPNVRWALAYLVDRNAIVDYALGGYGGTVDSQYGYAQWMYQDAGADLEEELIPIGLNIEAANERLDQTEWKYEADGVTPFDASKATADGSYMRYNDKGEMLTINHMGTDGVATTDAIEIQYTANAPLAGVNFVVTKSDFTALLDNYYYSYEMDESERQYNSFNMSTILSAVFDPYTQSFHSDKCGTWLNAGQLADDQLDELIMELRSTDPGDNETFLERWIEYEKRWQELLPQIPLFSNEEFDFFSESVHGVETTPLAFYSDVICKITKTAD
ncbi:MAG: ABC transporter substrate-binding protein [Clostridia bacterium]|nr:ABC transporter substrate-binding protein [Clostridia bacterium]